VTDDPLRLFLVVRRGAVETLDRAAVLAGAAALACVRAYEHDPEHAEAFAEWRPRPGKVCLRARSPSQWEAVLELPHALAGDAVAALPPRRRSERGPALERLQAMSTDLGDPPSRLGADDDPAALTYVLNPRLEMSSGKVVAQVAHAAVMAGDALPGWDGAGRLVRPSPEAFDALQAGDLAARVVDAGLTEVPPGTVTVVALAPRAAPAALRDDRPRP
jgi:peptidyl-tRNA hydrolase